MYLMVLILCVDKRWDCFTQSYTWIMFAYFINSGVFLFTALLKIDVGLAGEYIILYGSNICFGYGLLIKAVNLLFLKEYDKTTRLLPLMLA